VVAAILLLPSSGQAEGRKDQRPNIVLMMADDMGYSDLGCYGGEIHTPNIDCLAAAGLRFTQFYNTARCCPTRAALITGLYPHQTGVGHMTNDRGQPGYRGFLNDRCVTIAEVLGAHGYRTLMAGKWHVSPFDFRTRDVATHRHVWPLQRGFHSFYGTLAGGGSFFNPPGLMDGNELVRPNSPDYYYTDRISDKAVEYVRRHGGNERPFFLYVAYTSPHWPLHALPQDIAKYEGVYDRGWDALRAERLERMRRMGIVDARWKLTVRDPSVPPWEEAPHKSWEALRMAVYAAQIDRMDQGVGRIVDALEETSQLENTLIFFLADNGGCAEELYRDTAWLMNCGIIDETSPDGRPMQIGNEPSVRPGPADTFASYGVPWANASNTPFRLYKHWVHEGGIASPLVVHWPARIKARGELRHQPGHVIDIMATCTDVAGAKYPDQFKGQPIIPLAGKSLVPAFDDQPIGREAIYWEHEGNRAVRAGNWKLVAQHAGPWELYDLAADRTEVNDRADTHPERVRQMQAMYQHWADRSDVLPWPPKRVSAKE
jgi:arylsulfatase